MFQLILQATLFQWCFHYEIQSPELNKMVEGTVKHRYNIIINVRAYVRTLQAQSLLVVEIVSLSMGHYAMKPKINPPDTISMLPDFSARRGS